MLNTVIIKLTKSFPTKIKYIAKWVLGIGSSLLLVVPIIIEYVLAKDDKLVPHNFEVSGLPLSVIVGVAMILIAMLSDKIIPSGSYSRPSSLKVSNNQVRWKLDFEKVYTAAFQAARDSYFVLVDVNGS